MMPQMDQQDQALMASFQALSPLLMEAARYQRESGDEPTQKKLKHEQGADQPANRQGSAPPQAALLQMLQLMAKVVIQHERQLSQIHRQDCYVIFIQSHPQGALPLLTQWTGEWKQQWST